MARKGGTKKEKRVCENRSVTPSHPPDGLLTVVLADKDHGHGEALQAGAGPVWDDVVGPTIEPESQQSKDAFPKEKQREEKDFN